jgi:hypothetical protein
MICAIVAIFILICAIAATFILVGADLPDDDGHAAAVREWNAVCQSHDGVRSMEGMGNLAICRDGKVVER